MPNISMMERKTRWRLGEILLQKEWITWEQLGYALQVQMSRRGLLGEVLVAQGIVDRQNLYKALAFQHHVPFVVLRDVLVDEEILPKMPKWLVFKHRILPLQFDEDALVVVTDNPDKFWMRAILQEEIQAKEIRFCLACPADLTRAIERCYGLMPAVA